MRRLIVAALVAGLALGSGAASAGVPATERLWTVGARAFEDTLYDVAYRELGRFVDAAPEDPRRGDATLLRGRAAFALGRYEEALAAFRAAETVPLRDSTPGDVVFWQGEALFRLRQFDEARRRYGLLLRAYPDSPHAAAALYALGLSELELGHPDDAVVAFRRLVQEHGRSELAATASYAAARELVHQKRWDEALPLLATHASRFPGGPFLSEVRYLLGVVQVETGRRSEGVRTLEQFLAVNPRHDLAPAARLVLAEAHVGTGNPREALAQYQAFVKQAPRDPLVPRILYQMGELADRSGRSSDAEAAWLALRREHPDDPLAAAAGLELGGLYLKRRAFDRAMTVAREVAAAGGSRRVEALLLLGESALKAGKTDEAGPAYATARDEAPAGSTERYRALAGVGVVAEVGKEPAAARQAYGEIVAGAGDAELVRWARGRIDALEAHERALEQAREQAREKPAPLRPKTKNAPKRGGSS